MPTPNMRRFRSNERYVRRTSRGTPSDKTKSVSSSVNCPVKTLTGSPHTPDGGLPTLELPLPPRGPPPQPPVSPGGGLQQVPPAQELSLGGGAPPLPLNMAPVNSVITTPGSGIACRPSALTVPRP